MKIITKGKFLTVVAFKEKKATKKTTKKKVETFNWEQNFNRLKVLFAIFFCQLKIRKFGITKHKKRKRERSINHRIQKILWKIVPMLPIFI